MDRLQWRDRAGVSPASLLSPMRGTPTGWIRLLTGAAGRMFGRLRRYCKAGHSQRQCLLLRGLHSVAFTYNGRHQPCSASIGWATACERVSSWNLVAGKGCKWDLGFHEITPVKFGAYRVPGADACISGFEFSPYDYQSDMAGAPGSGGTISFGWRPNYSRHRRFWRNWNRKSS